MSHLAKILKAYRQKYDISQQTIADELGVVRSTICRIEKGKPCDHEMTIKLINWIFK